MGISASVGRMILAADKIDIKKRVEVLKKAYPVRYKTIFAGSAHWAAGNKNNPGNADLQHYDLLITGELKIWANVQPPNVTKAHTWMKNTGNMAISLAGMAGMSSPIWDRWRFRDDKYAQMVSAQQFELMCFLWAFFALHYSIPLQNIRTHAEYALMPYPGYPRGYYPERWDLKDMGPDMRAKTNWYLNKIKEVYDSV